MSRVAESELFVGIDTGGTFTDIVFRDGGGSGHYKLLSTPDDPGRAVLEGLGRLFGSRRADLVTYGTTVATNAMLERRGARTVLVTTAGFEDLLDIGRQARPDLYALEPVKPEPLVARALRVGVRERTLYDGKVETALDGSEIARVVEAVRGLRPESIAVCLLHAGARPTHERRLGRALARLGVPVTLSHRISPEPGEYERSSTAAANAYVRPKLAHHIGGLARASRARVFRVMQSNGGAIGARRACEEPVRTMLSGPAGGVAAAWATARKAGCERIITFDMGGTSTDVSLVDGAIARRGTTDMGALPIRTASVDIHTVGAGGGSIAFVDEGGSLKVGPRSAGAEPGPACYGSGNEATVTDAHLVLGRLRPDRFLGGHMLLDETRARAAVGKLARSAAARSLERAAEDVIRVVEGNMERAIRVISVERGQDPRTCTLVAFGGAAALHACGLAAGLGMRRILVPAGPGLLSARGVLDGPVLRDEEAGLRAVDPSPRELRSRGLALAEQARKGVEAEGVPRAEITVEVFAKARYLGQSIEIEVPLGPGFRARFHESHERLYRYSNPERSVEVVGLRATARSGAGSAEKTEGRRRVGRTRRRRKALPVEIATVFLDGRRRRVPVFEREALAPGAMVGGPAIIVEYSSTVLVAPGWKLSVDGAANLDIEPDSKAGG